MGHNWIQRIGSRVETRRFQATGRLRVNLHRPHPGDPLSGGGWRSERETPALPAAVRLAPERSAVHVAFRKPRLENQFLT
jgi:hypothetical protein